MINLVTELHLLTMNQIIQLILSHQLKYKLHYGLRCIGKNEQNQSIVLGYDIINLTNSVGLDLIDVVQSLLDQNKCIDFTTMWIGGRMLGWKKETLLNKIENVLTDCYTPLQKEHILNKLTVIFSL